MFIHQTSFLELFMFYDQTYIHIRVDLSYLQIPRNTILAT